MKRATVFFLMNPKRSLIALDLGIWCAWRFKLSQLSCRFALKTAYSGFSMCSSAYRFSESAIWAILLARDIGFSAYISINGYAKDSPFFRGVCEASATLRRTKPHPKWTLSIVFPGSGYPGRKDRDWIPMIVFELPLSWDLSYQDFHASMRITQNVNTKTS